MPASVAGSGLYFARLSWRVWRVGSSAAYGRYSVTSRAQRSALGTPAAVRAAAISDCVAVFADTFATAAALEGSDGVAVAGALALSDEAAAVGVGVGVAADPAAQAATTIRAAKAAIARRNRWRSGVLGIRGFLSAAAWPEDA
jgi:hypothetical protein